MKHQLSMRLRWVCWFVGLSVAIGIGLGYQLGAWTQVRKQPVPVQPVENKQVFGEYSELVINIPVHKVYSVKGGGFSVTTIEKVKVTAYNNLPEQTNNRPNIGASNRKVYEGSVALSRDLLDMYSIKYGDVVCMLANNRCFIVEDTMNKRYDNRNSPANGWRADIFMYDKKEALSVHFQTDLLLIKQL